MSDPVRLTCKDEIEIWVGGRPRVMRIWSISARKSKGGEKYFADIALTEVMGRRRAKKCVICGKPKEKKA